MDQLYFQGKTGVDIQRVLYTLGRFKGWTKKYDLHTDDWTLFT